MRIGFDLDGVLGDVSVVDWLLNDRVQDEKGRKIILQFLHDPKLKIHPSDLLHDTDEYIIITGRGEKYREITEKWLKKYGITGRLFMTDVGTAKDYSSLDAYFEALAVTKARYIKSECIEVYFEDSPDTVIRLRKLCPQCKIVQVGGRLL